MTTVLVTYKMSFQCATIISRALDNYCDYLKAQARNQDISSSARRMATRELQETEALMQEMRA